MPGSWSLTAPGVQSLLETLCAGRSLSLNLLSLACQQVFAAPALCRMS